LFISSFFSFSLSLSSITLEVVTLLSHIHTHTHTAPSASCSLYNHTNCILQAVHKHHTTIDGRKVGGGVTIITRGLYSSASYTFVPTLTTTVSLKNKKNVLAHSFYRQRHQRFGRRAVVRIIIF